MTVLRFTKSRTPTLPAVTRVSVPSQWSSVSQVVPLTVADEKRPTVRNAPPPLPQRWRTDRFGDNFLRAPNAAIFGWRGAFRQPLNLPPNRNRSANQVWPSLTLG